MNATTFSLTIIAFITGGGLIALVWLNEFRGRERNAKPPSLPPTMETGWLVENGKSFPDTRYRTIEFGLPAWTPDHLKAIRFARREDAEMFSAEDEDAWRIVEHGWHVFPEPINPQLTTKGNC